MIGLHPAARSDAGRRSKSPRFCHRTEDGHALAGKRNNRGTLLGYSIHFADLDETIRQSVELCLVDPLLLKRRREMERNYRSHRKNQRARQDRTRFRLQRAERDVRDQQQIRHVDEHVQALPDRSGKVAQPEVVTRGRHEEKDDQR